jgi:hypothetical protein
MKSYNQITGFFNFEQLYLNQIQNIEDNSVFVEVGSLWGRSVIFLGQMSKHYNKNIKIHSVDFWDVRGVPELMTPGLDPSGMDYIKDGEDCLYNAFLNNIKDCGVDDIIKPHRMSSEEGSYEFEDESIDFLFIDAGHTYEDITNDLNCWYKKVKPGKIISGHDYDWEDVKKAVDEFFGEENIIVENTSWIYKKPNNHTYSIIISYRDREDHLSILLPTLQSKFRYTNYEIIIAEQNDKDKFQKNSLYNLAAQQAKGDYLIFHDVDYIPTNNVSYETDTNTPLYPIRQVLFLGEDNQPRKTDDIPEGYRNFINDVGDHSGGVFVLSKELFYKMNGLNPYYKGWGKEDDDTRDRLRLLGHNWKRNEEGLFYALYHSHNCPENNDVDFINNHILLSQLKNNLHIGYKNVTADIEEFQLEKNIKWLKIKNFKYE